MDIAICRVVCWCCGGYGVGTANLELGRRKYGRVESVCLSCWNGMQAMGNAEYYDFPIKPRYRPDEDIQGNTNTGRCN